MLCFASIPKREPKRSRYAPASRLPVLGVQHADGAAVALLWCLHPVREQNQCLGEHPPSNSGRQTQHTRRLGGWSSNSLSPGAKQVTDFGLCNNFTDEMMMETFCGSMVYSPPEVLLQEPYAGPKADVWSMGAFLLLFCFPGWFCRNSGRNGCCAGIVCRKWQAARLLVDCSGKYIAQKWPSVRARVYSHMIVERPTLTKSGVVAASRNYAVHDHCRSAALSRIK